MVTCTTYQKKIKSLSDVDAPEVPHIPSTTQDVIAAPHKNRTQGVIPDVLLKTETEEEA